MRNKLIFRILGALASALIIVSVFIPFVSVTGYSQSLWQTHSAVGTLYFPIMIIVFGVIGVLVFSTNIKIELAYSSTGALLFFLIMQTIPIIDQGTFNTLGVGYYCLAVGTVLTGIFAFLCGLKSKKNITENKDNTLKQESMLSQIDKLYNNETSQTVEMPINQLDVIQPLQANDISKIQSNEFANHIEPIENSLPVEQTITDINNEQKMQPISNINDEYPQVQNINNISSVNNDIIPPTMVMEEQKQESISLQNLSTQDVVTEQPKPTTIQTINPVVSEFNIPTESINESHISNNPVIAEFDNGSSKQVGTNPVVDEFDAPQKTSILSQPVQPEQKSISEQPVEIVHPLSNQATVDLMNNNSNDNSNLDIFN